jgi:small subunit ribosomal protein S5
MPDIRLVALDLDGTVFNDEKEITPRTLEAIRAAIAKGVEDAKKNLVKIPVLHGTIPHKQEARYSGSLVMIRPAAPGTGVIAGGAMRAVLESVGIRNVLAKSKGSSNPHNLVKATVAALLELRDAYSVAQVRGVSLDTVFNG